MVVGYVVLYGNFVEFILNIVVKLWLKKMFFIIFFRIMVFLVIDWFDLYKKECCYSNKCFLLCMFCNFLGL